MPSLAALLLVLAPQHHDATPGPGPAPVLHGLDPVELASGREVPGQPAHVLDRNGFRYLFAGPENFAAFQEDPGRYEIQLGGGCGSMGPLSGAGDPDRYFVYGGRIYLFASEQCRYSFQMRPERYVEQPEVAPTTANMSAARERGRALLERVVEAMGGAEALDGVSELTLQQRAPRKQGDQTVDWSETLLHDFTTGTIARTQTWGDWTHRLELSDGVLRSTVVGEAPEVRGWAARHEFELQTARELPVLLRKRGNPGVLDVWSEGRGEADGGPLEKLVLRWNQHHTTAWVEPETGRVRRLTWTGRLGSGAIGLVEVEFSDFQLVEGELSEARPTVGLVLPRARRVRFDGEPVAHLSGPLAHLGIVRPR